MFRATTLERTLLVISDFIAFSICFVIAFWVQFYSGWIADKLDTTRQLLDYLPAGLLLSATWVFFFFLTGLYRSWLLLSRTQQALYVLRSILFGVVFLIVGLFGSEFIGKIMASAPLTEGYLYGSRFIWIFAYGLLAFFLVVFFRMLIYLFLRRLLRQGFGANRMLVLGATEMGAHVADSFMASPERGQKVIGFVDERYQVLPKEYANLPLLGKYSDLPRIVRENHVRGIIISHDSTSVQEIMRILVWLCDLPVHIYIIPNLYNVVHGHFKANLVHGFELQELFPFNMPLWQVRVKRAMDIIIAFGLLILSSPIFFLAAIGVKLDSKGPIFYSQERVGLYGRRFMVHKFRTMKVDAEKNGAQWATKNDPRITRIGLFLRRARIDELPQLLCVLKGDMSMVGPRPERAVFIEQLREQVPFYISRLKIKPGLTGWAQVRHHYDTSIEDVQKKLQYDMYYYENMSLLLDIQILFRTIYVVITGKGAQ